MSETLKRPVAAAFAEGQVPTVACVNVATVDLGVEWKALISALDKYSDIFASVWGTPCTIIDAGKGPVPPKAWGLVFLDDADAPGALGYHDLTPDGLPLSKIFVKTTLADNEKVSVTAAHELAEMLVDPGIQLSAQGPDGRTFYAYETADAVEREEFDIDGVAMSNFVYPSWFEAFRKPNSVKFDHLGNCTKAFEIRQGGYMPIFKNGQWSQIFGSIRAREMYQLRSHPRTDERDRLARLTSDLELNRKAAGLAPTG
jgi:hypothetical protein